MKWKAYFPSYKDRRIIRRFAWTPTLLSDGSTVVFFERFYVLQRYEVNRTWVDIEYSDCWSNFDEGSWYLQNGKFYQREYVVPELRY